MIENIRNIPASCSSVDVLAKELSADTPFDLATTLVLLPNRRACRELRDAFVRFNGMQPTILPRMLPLGDLDEDELFFAESQSEAAQLPPAVSATERTLLFIRLITARPDDFALDNISFAQAVYLAQELGQLLDTVESEELNFDNLSALVPEEYATHWQKTLDFLKIITQFLPDILNERGFVDSAQRRISLLKLQTHLWQQNPPKGRIVIAGTTAAFPAIRELVKTVANLPNGIVYLSDLDKNIDDDSWNKIDESHPQFELKQLLEYMEISRFSILDTVSPLNPEREKLISETMRPAAATDCWRELKNNSISMQAIDGLKLINCREIREEAIAIAAIMRKTLETPEKTAALVTANRNLARRTASELKRWNITVDDSAGRPLAQTPTGIFLRLIAEVCENNFENISLLSLLKHPLVSSGEKSIIVRSQTRRFEKNILRNNKEDKELSSFIEQQKEKISPLCELCQQPQADFKALLIAHLNAAEALAATEQKTGADILWCGDDGESAAALFSKILEYANTLQNIPQKQYGDFISALLSATTVRPKYGTHPRLKILGPIEARLSGFDTVIIGGVNEGSMPANASAGAWLSRPMKKDFGFPLPEKNIGILARDFSHLLAQKEVYLTRSDRVEGTPTVKSRWWMRLETVLSAAGIDSLQLYESPYTQIARLLDHPCTYSPISAPRPTPPVEARPRELWASAIENLMRDPYIIFARYILKLKPLEDINRKPGILDFGTIIHAILEKFNRLYPQQLPPDASAILNKIGLEIFATEGIDEHTLAFWQPALAKMIDWILQQENNYRHQIEKVYCEVSGRYSFAAPGGTFTIGAKADRIDLSKTGEINIIDYKTGRARSKKEIAGGYAPQLPIEGIIAQNGGFENIPVHPVNSLSYWRLGKEVISVNDNIDEILEHNLANIKALITAFDDASKPYLTQPNPKYAPTYSDYEHLSRIKEWGILDYDE